MRDPCTVLLVASIAVGATALVIGAFDCFDILNQILHHARGGYGLAILIPPFVMITGLALIQHGIAALVAAENAAAGR